MGGVVVPKAPAAISEVDGWPINLANMAQAVREISDAAEQAQPFAAFTLNMDHLVKLRQDSSFREAYRRARFVTADGAPVARLASQRGTHIERTTGADLVIPLATEAGRRGIPVYLFGTTPEVLGRAGSYLAEASDYKLNLVGTSSPPHGFDPASEAADRALEEIAASGAKLCFIALGAPKQELLAARAVEKGIPVGFVCIGAALDFLAGAQLRAPKAMQDTGTEWLWRLATNPRRLTVRYAQCAMLLADIAVWQPLKSRTLRPSA